MIALTPVAQTIKVLQSLIIIVMIIIWYASVCSVLYDCYLWSSRIVIYDSFKVLAM
jgi:hypothetical protein